MTHRTTRFTALAALVLTAGLAIAQNANQGVSKNEIVLGSAPLRDTASRREWG